PTEEGVNLMHGRNSDGIDARLTNISLARGLPPRASRPIAPQVVEAQAAADGFSASRAVLVDGLREIAWAARDRAAAGGASLVGSDAGFRRDLGSLLRKLGDSNLP